MDIRELGRLDLNLLVALEALLEEKSVSKAAERLFITQSAMSKTLSRLREVFNDPLFTRSASGMIPTPRAETLALHLPKVLQAVHCMIQPEHFDPSNHAIEFNITLPEPISIWALPMLMKKLALQAPLFRIKTEPQKDNQLDRLSTGKMDFIIQVTHQHYPDDFRVHTIGVAPPVLFARAGHPLEGKTLTWDMVKQYPQVTTRIADINEKQFVQQPDSAFIAHEKEIEATLETDHIFSALAVVRATDFIMPSLPIFIEEEELSRDIISLPLPDDEEIALVFAIVRHERTMDSAPHNFLMSLFLEVIEEYRHRNELPTLADMRELRGFDY